MFTKQIRIFGLCLLVLCSSTAQGQALATPTVQRIRPMNTDNNSFTAFFYQQPVVLNREQHRGLRFKPVNDARFASKNPSVPLLASEFASASIEYPIVFAKASDAQWLALALTGLQSQANAFVDGKGQWRANYVPASVRRYPFILAEAAADQLSLAADLAAPHWSKEGEALFDDKGEPTQLTRNLLAMLADFQAQAKQTTAMAQKLDEAQLLTQQNLQVQLADGRQAVIEGVWIVDEAKLRELADDKVLAWFKSGELAAIHAHMISLRNLVPLLERSQAPTAASEKPVEKAGKVGKSGASSRTSKTVKPSSMEETR
jgi:hypothetical protein